MPGWRTGNQIRAYRRQARVGRCAFDQNHAKALLQCLQLLAQGGLENIYGLRRMAEMPMIGHGDEVLNLSKPRHAEPCDRYKLSYGSDSIE